MKTNKTISVVISAILCSGILFTGCGGGDNSSNSGNNNNSLFSKNAKLAEPTLENANKVAFITKEFLPILKMPNINIDNLDMDKFNDIDEIQFTDTQDCDLNGSMTLTFNKNENYTNMTIIFNDCKKGSLTINGSISTIAKNFDSNIGKYKNYITKFPTDFVIKPDDDIIIFKYFANSYIEKNVNFDTNGNWKDYNLSTSLKMKFGIEDFGFQDCNFHFINEDDFVKYYQTEGKIYINNLNSYVEYDKNYNMSVTPFKISNDDTLISGEAQYIMSNNSKMKIVVLDPDNIEVEIDTDGDGEFELNESINE